MSAPSNGTTPSIEWPQPITGYDVHVYWLPSSKTQRAEAEALATRARAQFPQLVHGKCWDRPVGPHPYCMFEIDIHRAEDFGRFVPWLVLNHGNLSVLLHPHTGDDVRDHTVHALWLGEKVPLDIGLLAEEQKQKQG